MDQLLRLLNRQAPAEWGRILQLVRENDETSAWLDAVDTATSATALHLVACASAGGGARISATRDAETKQQRLAVIAALLHRIPEVTAMRCRANGYTPLAYAVQTVDIASIDEDAEIVKALLIANPAAVHLKTKGRSQEISPLCLHIQSVSRLLKNLPSACASTSVLQALISHNCDLAQLERALETIYICNIASVMERFTKEEQLYSRNVQQYGRHTRASEELTNFWVWVWVLCILENIHQKRLDQRAVLLQAIPRKKKEGADSSNATKPVRTVSKTPTFRALHTASQITDCPIPFLLFAMRAYPSQVRMSDPHNDNNLPLHSAATWQPKLSSCRKSMILTSLVAEHPKAVRTKNRHGKNPIELEASSGAVIV